MVLILGVVGFALPCFPFGLLCAPLLFLYVFLRGEPLRNGGSEFRCKPSAIARYWVGFGLIALSTFVSMLVIFIVLRGS